ncbi:hypothetical protein [Embleya sp. NPDC005575]|uniref:hypothetical protein n=1 Tax=Embleya sp. NPDC005575 TaxID=3156892 RepID=UPI0033BE69F3
MWVATVLDDPGVTRKLLLIALLLGTSARADGTGILVTDAMLVGDSGFPLSTVCSALDTLQQRGLLLQVHRGHQLDDGGHAVSEYALLMP